MKVSILTLFPEMFQGPFDHSIIKRAKRDKKIEIEFVNLRDFGIGRHRIVDDKPFGGGVGMVLRVDVIDQALQALKMESGKLKKTKTILLDARGETFTQKRARELAELDHLILIAGHYEGVDERVHEYLVDESVSIGNYVLTGGEIPAMVIVDSVTRLVLGVLKKQEATQLESFSKEEDLEHPQYTRPAEYHGWTVPDILLSGNHKKIEDWREKTQKFKKTNPRRKDFLFPRLD